MSTQYAARLTSLVPLIGLLAVTLLHSAVLRAQTGDAFIKPDEQIFFLGIREGKQAIYLLDTPSERVTRLSDSNYAASQPHLSPDGSTLVYTSNQDRNLEIMSVNLRTREIRNLTQSAQSEMSPRWSPNGQQIAYVGVAESGYSTVMVMNADGSNARRVGVGDFDQGEPRWSPDGRFIVYLQADSDKRNLMLLNVEDNTVTNITEESGGDNYDAEWSPDGETIYFASRRSRVEDIYRYEVATGGETNLTNTPETESAPRISPDGNWLVFERVMADTSTDIWVLNLLDGSELNLTENPQFADFQPSWSADGKHLVFVSLRDGNGEVYQIDMDGSNLRRLTNDRAYDSFPFPALAGL